MVVPTDIALAYAVFILELGIGQALTLNVEAGAYKAGSSQHKIADFPS